MRCQPRGRTSSVAIESLSRYCFVSVSRLSVRRTASIRFCCPSTTFSHVGDRGVLEVRHEDVRPAIERVDHHLARDGAGDLHPSPLEVDRRGGDLPLGRPDLGGVGEKVGLGAGVERGLSGDAVVEQRLASRVEGRVEIGHEGQRLRGQNGVGRLRRFPGDGTRAFRRRHPRIIVSACRRFQQTGPMEVPRPSMLFEATAGPQGAHPCFPISVRSSTS